MWWPSKKKKILLTETDRSEAVIHKKPWGAWVAQSVKHPTLAQVVISQLVTSSPVSGFVLTVQSLEPASNSVSPFLSAPPLPCVSKINKC